MIPLKRLITTLVLFCIVLNARSQSIYSYAQLSKTFYARQKDSLKKNWDCPTLYKEKATQKEYRTIWDDRTNFIVNAIDDQNYVYEPGVFNYVQGIINDIVNGNPQLFTDKPFLLVDRSSSANAYAVGGNIIAVNLGLIDFAESREEIALAIAHEMSHNILHHVDNMMKERAEWLSSDEYKKSINAVLDSKYERLTRLKKLLEGYSFNRSRHQRYHESDADSLAIVMLKNSKIPFEAGFFLRLDSTDLQYKQPLLHPLREYFEPYGLPFEQAWMQKKSKGLSTRNYNFKDTTTLDDSLKTHPDCPQRYKNTLALSDDNATLTPIPAGIKQKVAKMVIWNMYDNMGLTPCLYRILQQKDKGVNDQWYDFMLHNIFAGLEYNDRQLHRFIAIGITQKEYISTDYYAMQNMLEQMPRESLAQYCTVLQNANFWGNRPADEKAMKIFLYALAINPDDTDKVKWNAASDFESNNAASMYCEFADHFKKK